MSVVCPLTINCVCFSKQALVTLLTSVPQCLLYALHYVDNDKMPLTVWLLLPYAKWEDNSHQSMKFSLIIIFHILLLTHSHACKLVLNQMCAPLSILLGNRHILVNSNITLQQLAKTLAAELNDKGIHIVTIIVYDLCKPQINP